MNLRSRVPARAHGAHDGAPPARGSLIARFRDELRVYRLVLRHPATPRISRWILGMAIAYALSPIDLVPDFIPVLGHLDDLILLPLLVWSALRLVPPHVVQECRQQVLDG